MNRTRPHLLRTAAILFASALPALAGPVAPSAPDPRKGLDLTHQLYVSGCGTLAEARLQGAASPEEMRLGRSLFSFCAGARMLFDQAHSNASTEALRSSLTWLLLTARQVDEDLLSVRVYRDVVDSWQESRAALGAAQQYWQVADPPAGARPSGASSPAGGATPGSGTAGGTGPSGATQPPGGTTAGTGTTPPSGTPVDWYAGLFVEIERSEFRGTLNPPLVLEGTFRGKNISHADLVIYAGEKEIYRETNAFPEIGDHFKTRDRAPEATIPFTIEIPSSDLGAGENRIQVILVDKSGRKNYDAVNRTKRTVNW